MHAQSLQSCLIDCDPMDCSSPGSSVHGILQARILEWVAMPFSRGSSQPKGLTHLSCISCIAGGFSPAEPYHEDIPSSALERPLGPKTELYSQHPGKNWSILPTIICMNHLRSIFFLAPVMPLDVCILDDNLTTVSQETLNQIIQVSHSQILLDNTLLF